MPRDPILGPEPESARAPASDRHDAEHRRPSWWDRLTRSAPGTYWPVKLALLLPHDALPGW